MKFAIMYDKLIMGLLLTLNKFKLYGFIKRSNS